MSSRPTIVIVDPATPGDSRVIDADDFDPARHQRFDEHVPLPPQPPPQAPKPLLRQKREKRT